MSAGVVKQAIPMEIATPRDNLLYRFDARLAGSALALLGLGLVMVASSSVSTAARDTGEPLYFFWRQGAFVVIGLFAAWVATRAPLIVWHRAGPVLLVAGIAALVLVLVPGVGRAVNGSMRWISIGVFNLQPSEPMKLFMVIYLAGYLVRRSDQVKNLLSGFVKPISVLAGIAFLLLLEPDYGATVVLFATALGMLFLGGVPFWAFAGWVGVIVLLMAGVVLLEPYRLTRLLSFVNPWADPFGSGFQLTQALIAIGRGEWFGVGLGAGVQKLFYLPEAHTDFLFAILAEELGFVGAISVIGLFSYIVWRAMSIARDAELGDKLFDAYLAYGIGLLIGLQAFVNIGVNLGILPTKGLTLPLMSYGGSSLIVNCFAIGLLLRVEHEARLKK